MINLVCFVWLIEEKTKVPVTLRRRTQMFACVTIKKKKKITLLFLFGVFLIDFLAIKA